MKCQKCGFVSFDYLSQCKRCGMDLTEVRLILGHMDVRPSAPSFLDSLISRAEETLPAETVRPLQQQSAEVASQTVIPEPPSMPSTVSLSPERVEAVEPPGMDGLVDSGPRIKELAKDFPETDVDLTIGDLELEDGAQEIELVLDDTPYEHQGERRATLDPAVRDAGKTAVDLGAPQTQKIELSHEDLDELLKGLKLETADEPLELTSSPKLGPKDQPLVEADQMRGDSGPVIELSDKDLEELLLELDDLSLEGKDKDPETEATPKIGPKLK